MMTLLTLFALGAIAALLAAWWDQGR